MGYPYIREIKGVGADPRVCPEPVNNHACLHTSAVPGVPRPGTSDVWPSRAKPTADCRVALAGSSQ